MGGAAVNEMTKARRCLEWTCIMVVEVMENVYLLVRQGERALPPTGPFPDVSVARPPM